jgi:hypothetical protein
MNTKQMPDNFGSIPLRLSVSQPGTFPINFLWMVVAAMQPQIAYELLLGNRSGCLDNA